MAVTKVNSNKIKVDALQGAISDALRLYSQEIIQATNQAIDETIEELVVDLKSLSPKDTGKYAKSWTKKGITGSWIVYNKDRYRLSHLLENGYVRKDGVRVQGRRHISVAQQRAEIKLNRRFEELLGR